MKYNAGKMRLAPPILGEILRLPKDNEVKDIWVLPDGTLEIIIEGDLMPEIGTHEPPADVNMLFTAETRPGDVEKGGAVRRVTACFAHRPDIKWTVRNWETING